VKPRIVRENVSGEGFPFALHECARGIPYLALPWPKVGTGPGECPYTPEQVMAACERNGHTPAAVPYEDGWWKVRAERDGCFMYFSLTPEFIGEPKCDAPGHEWTPPANCFSVCPSCGAILSDRRYYTQRKEERRKVGPRYEGGRRRSSGQRERRFFTDRRAKR